MSTSSTVGVITRSGKTYNLTAHMSAADRMRRAHTSMDELDAEGRENTASRRTLDT